jgi:hypothetical protein
MTLSRLAHTTRNGGRLFAVLSLDTLRAATPEQLPALQTLGIHSIGDLLDYPPIHDAQLLVALADGVIGHDTQLTTLVVAAARNTPHVDLARLPIDQLARLTAAHATIWRRDLGVVTVEQLARFGPFIQAQRFLAQDVFEEEPSAPQELIPLAVGSVSNISRYSSFVSRERFRFRRDAIGAARRSGAAECARSAPADAVSDRAAADGTARFHGALPRRTSWYRFSAIFRDVVSLMIWEAVTGTVRQAFGARQSLTTAVAAGAALGAS